ncbi:Flp family type IVb pilin [Vibrio hannami]|uniref:Flp family type IVb pilin n=1 Tax=Vibrio hannami TaxID=2717094 RepID=UPI00240F24E0|nr:Flp family type IVb pilin [Vibrio hannami]MDG3085996.1 Flp family type IVb pilin [Vibrio hannami]
MLLSTYVKAKLALEKFKNDERGVTAIEYAVIGGAIAAVLLVFFVNEGGIQDGLTDAFEKLQSALGTATEDTGTGDAG